MVPAVSTTGLTRRFGDFIAVQDVNLTVAPGQFFGFLGPNGAGKSTTIKMLTGLLAPTSGSIQILGLDAIANPIEVKRQIGVVPEGLALFGRLTAAEYLRFVGRMYGLDQATTATRTGSSVRAGRPSWQARSVSSPSDIHGARAATRARVTDTAPRLDPANT